MRTTDYMNKHDELEDALRGIRSATPTEPPLDSLLAAAGRSMASPQRSFPLALRLAALLALTGAVTIALQIAGQHAPQPLRPTLLRQINPAWSAAEGYVLEFTVYDESRPAGDGSNSSEPVDPPNYVRFRKAAFAWADRHGLDYQQKHPEVTMEELKQMGFRFSLVGGGNWNGQHSRREVQINLRSDQRELVDDLVATLSALPGTAEPQVSQQSLYFYRGGMTTAMQGMVVVVDGAEYAFPQDFTPGEAQGVYWLLRGAQDARPTYTAFRKYLHDGPEDSRFGLGDVVRIHLETPSRLVLSTLLAEWDVPHGDEHILTRGVSSGWGFKLPPGVDEDSIDPVLELSRRFDPLPGDKYDLRYRLDLAYWLVPREQFFSSGSSGITAEQATAAMALGTELSRTLEAWKAANPQVKRSLVWRDRVFGEIVQEGQHALLFHVSARTDNPAEIDSLQAALAAVTDAPEPVSNYRDMQELNADGIGANAP